ncbi:hypothetical protein [Mycolicibacterium sp.]|uniref:hypothetical protein n=1 Tax=Mycolicibacterium sp. TaxID=2320850 RepID=UPI0037CC2F33
MIVPRLPRLVAVLAIAAWAGVLAGQWQAAGHDRPVHLPHAVSAAIDPGSAVLVDHPHAGDGSTPHAPDSFTAAVLPRATVTAAALLAVAFVVGCVLVCGCAVVRTLRGPPDHHGVPPAGQSLLLRICIARR